MSLIHFVIMREIGIREFILVKGPFIVDEIELDIDELNKISISSIDKGCTLLIK